MSLMAHGPADVLPKDSVTAEATLTPTGRLSAGHSQTAPTPVAVGTTTNATCMMTVRWKRCDKSKPA